MANKIAVLVEKLSKNYGKFKALDGLNLSIERGSILAVLGPNGAGKTTTVRCLTTLLLPDSGRVEIAGYDVIKYPDKVRACIGLTGQFAAVDDRLTGLENLEMFGQLYHLPRKLVKQRSTDLLKQFDLIEESRRLVKTYSGGMRRRLDLAASFISHPAILFLDEPTTGLDPRARLAVWEVIRGLVTNGTTVFLTTQYLEEADQLADHIAVIDQGHVIVEGTSNQLKKQIGGERLEITIADGCNKEIAIKILSKYAVGQTTLIDSKDRHIITPLSKENNNLTVIIRDLEASNIIIEEIGLRRPTLDDVFLSFTGHYSKAEQIID
jgi:ABC-2 type transport system ATP-binding protein